MNAMEAIEIIETGMNGDKPADQDTLVSAWQYLIDTGLAFTLQGWYGRTAAYMIDAGLCTG